MNKLKQFVLFAFCGLLIGLLITLALNSTGQWKELFTGPANDREDLFAKAGEIEILKSEVADRKESNSLYGLEQSDKEIVEEMVLKRLLEKEAEKAGISFTDEEVQFYMDETRRRLPEDDRGYEEFKRYIEIKGWSEDQYWTEAFPVYKRSYIIGKYKNDYLKAEFIKQNNITDSNDFDTLFNAYYEGYTGGLLKSVTIEYFE